MHRANHRHWRPRSTYCAGPAKRTFDVVVAGLLAVLTAPVVVALALGSALAFRAWPFFVQDRLGRGGESFRFVKIRSLPTDAPRYADKYTVAAAGNNRFGRLLRASHLDELPQLWLVVSGRMSLVGPRPEMAVVAETFEPSFVAARTRIRPGCTGPWQVSESADRLIGEDTRFDLYYLSEATFGLDLAVLWRTFAQLLGAAPLTYDRLCGSIDGYLGDRPRAERDLDVAVVDDASWADAGGFRRQLLALFDESYEPWSTGVG